MDGDDTREKTLTDLAIQLDSENMIGFTRAFVSDLRKGFDFVTRMNDEWFRTISSKHWISVLCLGMGGSASGGDFLSALANAEGSTPIHVHRDYSVPSWWNTDVLVIATSHSGSTEETIEATERVLRAGGTVIVIATGGELAGFCELYPNCHLIPTIGGQPPRSAFGHIFSRQLACLQRLGLLPALDSEMLEHMLDRLEQVTANFDFTLDPEGDIAQLAAAMKTRPIALLGPTECQSSILRFKNQLNENAARFARIGIIPEMNHNEIVAWGGVGDDGDPANDSQLVLMLSWKGMHPRVKQRLDWLIAHSPTEYAWKIQGEGETLLEALLYHCIIMDWLSIALALLHGKDPSSIHPINSLKGFLQSVQ